METSPRPQQFLQQQLPSPTSHSCSSSSSNSNGHTPSPPATTLPHSPKPIPTRSEPANPYPTTYVQADTATFKQVVQMLTGSPRPKAPSSASTNPQTEPSPPSRPTSHSIPPIKSIPKKSQASSGFKLYERRNSLKNFKINPLNPIFAPSVSGFSPRKPEILSPSILDFPSLVLSPVTPLIPDPFDRSSSGSPACNQPPIPCSNALYPSQCSNWNPVDAEERAIKEKGFYFLPSPTAITRETTSEPPRLLPLFPVTSSGNSGSITPSS